MGRYKNRKTEEWKEAVYERIVEDTRYVSANNPF